MARSTLRYVWLIAGLAGGCLVPAAVAPGDASSRTYVELFCPNKSGTGSFIGANNGPSSDAGEYTGVLSGAGNQTCGSNSVIFAGGYVVDVSSGEKAAGPSSVADAQDSFIGAGDLNWTSSDRADSSTGAFIGAGGAEEASTTGASASDLVYGNQARGDDTFVGAGDLNRIIGRGNGTGTYASFAGAGGYERAHVLEAGQPPEDGDNVINAPDAFIGAGDLNEVDLYPQSFIGAGGFMTVLADGGSTGSNAIAVANAFIGAGDQNSITGFDVPAGVSYNRGVEGGQDSFIGTGQQNTISRLNGSEADIIVEYAFIGSGDGNVNFGITSFVGAGGTLGGGNRNGAPGGFIGAGDSNTMPFRADEAIIGGGKGNQVGNFDATTIGGGASNSVGGTGSSVAGGFENEADGGLNAVVGGFDDVATDQASFAGGYHAKANGGSFLWSDYNAGSSALHNAAGNQFVARASGGVTFYSSESASSGVKLAPGSGSWSNLSDRNAKFDIAPLDGDALLDKVARLPVSAWRYKTESDIQHAGPMAQDFYAAFGVGEDDRHITSIDEDGVTLAAIKALWSENAGLWARLDGLKSEHVALEHRLAALEARRQLSAPRGPSAGRRRRAVTQCYDVDGMGSFIGANNEASAGGASSGVLSGGGVESCGSGSAIGGGGGDIADGTDSFAGAGNSNDALGAGSFVGAGGYRSGPNMAAGTDSFVGAGDQNVTAYNGSYGNGAFIGAGSANQDAGTDAFIGAGSTNLISSGGSGSFIGSAGSSAISALDSFIGAGTENNIIGGYQSFIGAGQSNSISGGKASFIGSGTSNSVTAAGAFIGGGGANNQGNQNAGRDAVIGAGNGNVIAANSSDAFIGAGSNNLIAKTAPYSTILGGEGNTAGASYASVLGGSKNTASGSYAVVPGGDGNVAHGIASFAAGSYAEAQDDGSFVWADYDKSSSAMFEDSGANQFDARASGGVYFYSNEGDTSGVELRAGGGSWMSLSDRSAMTGIAPLDDAAVLAKVASLPVRTWRYKTEPGVRHIGPMAQDFYAAFGVGEDDRHIASIDEAGVALSAIKALQSSDHNLQTSARAFEVEGSDLQRRLDLLAAKSKT